MRNLSMALPLAILAFSAAAQVTIVSAGDCSKWIKNQSMRGAYLYWISGYLSGVNSLSAGILSPDKREKADFLKGRSPEQIEVLVDQHCQAKPLDTLQEAASSAIEKLHAGR